MREYKQIIIFNGRHELSVSLCHTLVLTHTLARHALSTKHAHTHPYKTHTHTHTHTQHAHTTCARKHTPEQRILDAVNGHTHTHTQHARTRAHTQEQGILDAVNSHTHTHTHNTLERAHTHTRARDSGCGQRQR